MIERDILTDGKGNLSTLALIMSDEEVPLACIAHNRPLGLTPLARLFNHDGTSKLFCNSYDRNLRYTKILSQTSEHCPEREGET